ncbi:hypothetical protein CYV19_00450 [Natronobacterium gregoryi SP2]|uniref:Uncharacterized protein n=1 Tax=Natronobacterium gregoryi (strain ATCC 43098 / DSM 3393 / CCM 3738 / CIP 104747 / IAM 13177 / JCM 8860 / NBRC 102187 / NCIMB 2189 / SP2) TaxID=797304 RepID=L9XQ54_NATGS|nr:hypothetical protein C490_16024 [Natronobacterium gregoryi SP2]PLK22180.1 hypothetical protein CYV19_00450 [Natronobacterium gregoryi SP2]
MTFVLSGTVADPEYPEVAAEFDRYTSFLEVTIAADEGSGEIVSLAADSTSSTSTTAARYRTSRPSVEPRTRGQDSSRGRLTTGSEHSRVATGRRLPP